MLYLLVLILVLIAVLVLSVLHYIIMYNYCIYNYNYVTLSYIIILLCHNIISISTDTFLVFAMYGYILCISNHNKSLKILKIPCTGLRGDIFLLS